MVDFLTPAQRSRRMSLIRQRDTAPELVFRRAMHSLGFRFRLHVSSLPGKPDLVFPKYKTVVFVHGCFWHRHVHCKIATVPKSNTEFWTQKFNANVLRDARNTATLLALGWRVLVVWECQLNTRQIEETVQSIATQLKMHPPSSAQK